MIVLSLYLALLICEFCWLLCGVLLDDSAVKPQELEFAQGRNNGAYLLSFSVHLRPPAYPPYIHHGLISAVSRSDPPLTAAPRTRTVPILKNTVRPHSATVARTIRMFLFAPWEVFVLWHRVPLEGPWRPSSVMAWMAGEGSSPPQLTRMLRTQDMLACGAVLTNPPYPSKPNPSRRESSFFFFACMPWKSNALQVLRAGLGALTVRSVSVYLSCVHAINKAWWN